jgi:hypothetical protein
MIFVLQAGRNRHEHICESLELFAQEVMPPFVDGREQREAAKAERLAGPIEAALARREPARELSSPYVIDEQAEVSAAARRAHPPQSPRELATHARARARRAARERAIKLLARAVDGADDASLERRFGSRIVQRALFSAMAASFEPDAAGGFEGSLVYELGRPATGARPTRWTIEVLDGRAVARAGGVPDPALTVHFPLSDFVRVAAGTMDPAVPLLRDRASFEGDFSLAAKLPEMFGAPSPY